MAASCEPLAGPMDELLAVQVGEEELLKLCTNLPPSARAELQAQLPDGELAR